MYTKALLLYGIIWSRSQLLAASCVDDDSNDGVRGADVDDAADNAETDDLADDSDTCWGGILGRHLWEEKPVISPPEEKLPTHLPGKDAEISSVTAISIFPPHADEGEFVQSINNAGDAGDEDVYVGDLELPPAVQPSPTKV